ncbi:hypothetical protein [Leyella stercorea]|uniref:hypothetical protein n=1 Tax=Leyella stercorea TaxID=363265 RepID=UPI00242AE9E9|nr:hypothetical protein [Leyella stercorea]
MQRYENLLNLQSITSFILSLTYNSVVVGFGRSASTGADVCIDRRGCLHRPARMSASTGADVCIDRRGCLHRPARMWI